MTQVILLLYTHQMNRVNSENSSDKCSTVPTHRPSQPTMAVSPPVGCYCLDPPSPFIITHADYVGRSAWVRFSSQSVCPYSAA